MGKRVGKAAAAAVGLKLTSVAVAVFSACLLAGCAATTSDLDAAFNGGSSAGAPIQTASTNDTPGASSGEKRRAPTNADVFATDPNGALKNYKIGALDLLDVSVYKVADLSRSVQVAANGNINYPLLGEVRAAGLTPDELERDLASRLGATYLQNPQVSVYVKTFNSQRFTIEGGIKKPGVYPLTGETSLLQAMAVAGGLTDLADESNIVVFRQVGPKRHAARFDVSAIRSGTVRDPMLRKGDVVVVHDSAMKKAWNNISKALPVAGIFTPLL